MTVMGRGVVVSVAFTETSVWKAIGVRNGALWCALDWGGLWEPAMMLAVVVRDWIVPFCELRCRESARRVYRSS